MVEFENLRPNGSDLSEQAALVLPHLETTQEFLQGVYLGQILLLSPLDFMTRNLEESTSSLQFCKWRG